MCARCREQASSQSRPDARARLRCCSTSHDNFIMMAEADYDSEDEAFLKTYDDVPKPVDTSQLASEGLRSRAALALRFWPRAR